MQLYWEVTNEYVLFISIIFTFNIEMIAFSFLFYEWRICDRMNHFMQDIFLNLVPNMVFAIEIMNIYLALYRFCLFKQNSLYTYLFFLES